MSTSEVVGSSYLEDYMTEVLEIKISGGSTLTTTDGTLDQLQEDGTEDDEGDKEFDFLYAIGLEKVAKRIRAGDGIDETALAELRSTLTAEQAATVLRQASRLHQTTHRIKLKPTHRGDVRDINFQKDSEDGGGISTLRAEKLDITSTKKIQKEEPVCISEKSSTNNVLKIKSSKAKSPIQSKKHSDGDSCFIPPSQVKSSLVQSGVNLISVVPTGDRAGLIQSPLQQQQDKRASVKVGEGVVEEEEIVAVDTPTANSFLRPTLSRRDRGTQGYNVTYIDEYGQRDIKAISKFSLLEIETKFDQHKISYSKRKSKKKPRDQGVFGVALQSLLERDSKNYPNIQVPLVFHQLIEQLNKKGVDEVGLLRVPGNQTRIKALREELDNGHGYKSLQKLSESITCHDLAGLLKLLLRELPAPLLTLERVDAFTAVLQIRDEIERREAVNLLLLTLPDVNRETIRLLLRFLREVVACPDNKMTAENVSLIMAPNLFLPGLLGAGSSSGSKLGSSEDELRAATETSSIVKLMINYQQLLFEVPELIVSQVRNENEKKASKSGVFSVKKDKGSTSEAKSTSPRSVCVSLEESSTETLVSLSEKTTAHDVISDVMCSRKSSSKDSKGGISAVPDTKLLENVFLYEVGGNIGERRLNQKVSMIAVQERNPQAKYIIKTKRL